MENVPPTVIDMTLKKSLGAYLDHDITVSGVGAYLNHYLTISGVDDFAEHVFDEQRKVELVVRHIGQRRLLGNKATRFW